MFSDDAPGFPFRLEDYRKVKEDLTGLLVCIGVNLHPLKGEWEGAQVLHNHGLVVDTVRRLFLIPPERS